MIRHPDEHMTDEERAYEIWAVHPRDLDRLGFTEYGEERRPDGQRLGREMFFLAHIKAAKKQASRDAREGVAPEDFDHLESIRRKLVFHHAASAHEFAALARFEAVARGADTKGADHG